MPEPIDRQAAIKLLNEMQDNAATGLEDVTLYRAIKVLREMPTIEPEVRHGRMIEGRYPNENKCSECGQEFRDDIGFIIQDDDGVFHYPKRCPECGCYWDGGADNG